MTAVAAATAGETRWVRPPVPCRPSKLRLQVEARALPRLRAGRGSCPGTSSSRRCATRRPAREDLVEPLHLGLRLDLHRAGDDEHPDPVGDLSGRAGCPAAARRSSIRPLVHEPRKTVSTVIVAQRGARRSGPCRPGRARRPRRSAASANVARVGHPLGRAAAPWPGLVPQVTKGVSAAASMSTSRSKAASVVGAQRAASTRRRRPSRRPSGRAGGPSGKSNVVSSGRDHPGAGAGLDAHVADRHPAFHRQLPRSPRRGTR